MAHAFKLSDAEPGRSPYERLGDISPAPPAFGSSGPSVSALRAEPRIEFPSWTARAGQRQQRDAVSLEAVAGVIEAGLRQGRTVMVVAGAGQRERLEARLESAGLDVLAAIRSGRYMEFDVVGLLSKVILAGRPDADRFAAEVGERLARAGKHGPVYVYTETSIALCAQGNPMAATRLNAMWEELARDTGARLISKYRQAELLETSPPTLSPGPRGGEGRRTAASRTADLLLADLCRQCQAAFLSVIEGAAQTEQLADIDASTAERAAAMRRFAQFQLQFLDRLLSA